MLERTGRCRAEVVRLTNKTFGLQPRDERRFGTLPAELKAAGCQCVFQEKVSGARTDRRQLARLLAELDAGDTVILTRLDRLARLDAVSKSGGHVPLAARCVGRYDQPHSRLILTVLGGLAEFERHLIAARTSEGRKRAVCCSGAPAS
jgi:DNA invertase Pin-like site-specific DNA recombinase